MNTAKVTLALFFGSVLTLAAASMASAASTLTVYATVTAITSTHVTANPPNLALAAPTAGGTAPSVSDSSTYLLYTSTVASSQTHTVSVSLSAALPTDVKLTLQAGTPSGAAGSVGSPTAAVSLSTASQNLITGIGACYTGTGVGSGAQLTYQLSVSNWASYKAFTTTPVTVTFTMN
jgi:hypothetical protein